MRPDAESTAKTATAIVTGTWACAGIVMTASAINAVLTYGAIGDNRVLGLATGLAVDVGLCVALIGDRRLHAAGMSSPWGRALRITTMLMALVLNAGVAIRDGRWFSALLHAFLPLLLVLVTEYGQALLVAFAALARDTRAPVRAVTQPAPTPASAPTAPALPLPQPMTPAVSIPPAQVVIPPQPAPAPQQQQPAPSPATKPRPATARTSKTTAELLRRGRALQTDRAAKGLPKAGRRILMTELGITDRAARALVSQLDAEPNLEAVA